MSKTNREAFVFYKDWWNAISGLPKDVRGEVCEGVIRYAFGETEAGLGSMATMALRFITPQIDRDREKYEATCKARQEAGRLGSVAKQANATKCYQMLPNGSKSKQKQHDNDNDNEKNISLSLSPSREVESVESVGSDGLTAVERETLFEILFFKNFKNPTKELERLIGYYSANGWRRHGDVRAVNDKKALAQNWKPEKETDVGRFDPATLAKLQAIYAEIKAENKEDAATIIHGTERCETTIDGFFRIICASKAVLDAYEAHLDILKRNDLMSGRPLRYAVPKTNQ